MISLKKNLDRRSALKSLLVSTAIPAMFGLVYSQSAYSVNIALIDSGVNPGVLGGVTQPGGYDFVNDDDDPSDEIELKNQY